MIRRIHTYDGNDIVENKKMLITTLVKMFPEHKEEILTLKMQVVEMGRVILKSKGMSNELFEKIKKEFPLSIS